MMTTDKLKAKRIVRDMYQLSMRYNVRNVKELISLFRLNGYIDQHIEDWTNQETDNQDIELIKPINAN
jgi:hypothetical protein